MLSLKMHPSAVIEQKILPENKLAFLLQRWRLKEEKVVFTNGCFDLLHQGHVHTLSQAAGYGSKLIVGLNSDSSVRKLKGESRPIQDEHSRAILLASLFFVDIVLIFDELTPYRLIKAIQPDVLVKGGDYTPESVVGGDMIKANGGQVIIIPYLSGFSTTNIIKKM